ncbi:MAG TPA: hypothetical protein K8U76_00510, partial [Bilophila wadsworthia]|uniref:hypothetical protein n=1 Tax=Bilophila wadsworthia TaxID=35833 RepID=UPI001D459AF7
YFVPFWNRKCPFGVIFCPSFASKQEYHAVFFLERAKNFSFDRIMVLFLYDYKDIPVRSFLKVLSFKKAQ